MIWYSAVMWCVAPVFGYQLASWAKFIAMAANTFGISKQCLAVWFLLPQYWQITWLLELGDLKPCFWFSLKRGFWTLFWKPPLKFLPPPAAIVSTSLASLTEEHSWHGFNLGCTLMIKHLQMLLLIEKHIIFLNKWQLLKNGVCSNKTFILTGQTFQSVLDQRHYLLQLHQQYSGSDTNPIEPESTLTKIGSDLEESGLTFAHTGTCLEGPRSIVAMDGVDQEGPTPDLEGS